MRPVLTALVLSGALVTTIARAQSDEDASQIAARTLGYAGVEAYNRGDYASASDKLENAYRLFPVPSLALWSARALIQRDLLLEAAARFAEVGGLPVALGDAPVQERAKADAAREHAELMERIPRVTLELSGAAPGEVTVTLDGAPLAPERLTSVLLLNPGRHALVATRGVERSEVFLRLLAGDREAVPLVFQAVNAPDPAPVGEVAVISARAAPPGPDVAPAPVQQTVWRTAGWVAVGVGGASLVTGLIAYIAGKNKQSTMEARGDCNGEQCLVSDDLGSYDTFRAINQVGWIAGSVLTAAGVTVLVLDPGRTARGATSAQKNAAPLTLRVDAGRLRLSGSF
jgi:hypothetical protein